MADPFLIGEAMTGGYGGADILHSCTIAVEKGEIAVIVGPNGAGKSTAMKAMFGMLSLRQGRVMLGDRDITALSPQDRVKAGMGFVPQTSNVFVTMSVQENLEMGAYIRQDDFSDTMAQVFDLFPILKEKRRQPAGELSGGQRQQVAVGRALMTRPSVLMLDEPTAGVSPIVMDELFDRILEVAATGIAILMVEQNARQALAIADRGGLRLQVVGKHVVDGRVRHEPGVVGDDRGKRLRVVVVPMLVGDENEVRRRLPLKGRSTTDGVVVDRHARRRHHERGVRDRTDGDLAAVGLIGVPLTVLCTCRVGHDGRRADRRKAG